MSVYKPKAKSINFSPFKNTFLTDKLLDDFESKRGLKECDPEYFVIPHPSIPPPVLLVKPP